VSRWADAFAALSRGADTLDTMRHSAEPPPIVSQSVNSVMAPPAPSEAPGEPPSAPEPDGGGAAPLNQSDRPTPSDTLAIGEGEAAAPAKPDDPAGWRAGFARLDADRPPAGLSMPPRRWRAIIEAIGAFLDRWGAEAARLGWTAHDVFGADADRPEVTWLNSGPLWSAGDGAGVIEVHADRIVFETPTGARQTAPKRPLLRPRVLPWELAP
jgi:hypothetical protein